MQVNDRAGFFVDNDKYDKESHVIFDYIFETLLDPEDAAARLCQETSTAQWKRPNVDEDYRPKYAAKIVDLEVLASNITSAFTPGHQDPIYNRVRVKIAHPYHNFGLSIPGLLTVAMGEGAFFSHGINAIKLIDIVFPHSYLSNFSGPNYGVHGLRKLIQVMDRPLFFGVVKPNVGLDPTHFASLAYESLAGGLDMAKDDEMLCDPVYSPFETRMALVGKALKDAQDDTGQKKIFIANITNDLERMIELHDIAIRHGINAVMVNVLAVGLSAIRSLSRYAQIPIVAHFDCIAPMSMHPYFGVSSTVITKLQRLVGCDAIIMPGFGERMKTPDAEVLANIQACHAPFERLHASLPVPGGSDWAGSLKGMIQKIGHYDFAMVPGRGVFGHPHGPRAGAMSLQQAWNAHQQGISIDAYAKDHDALRLAIHAFGR